MEAPWIFDGAFDPSQLIEAAADDTIDVWKKTQRRIHNHTQIPDPAVCGIGSMMMLTTGEPHDETDLWVTCR